MLKRISVHQLTVGMHLKEFCGSWMEHPFWRTAFVITDPETNTIEELPRFQWDPEKAAKSRRDNLLKEAKAKREEDMAKGKLDFERRRAEWKKQQAEKKQRLDKQWNDSMRID